MKHNGPFNFNNTYTTLPHVLYTRTTPVRVKNPQPVILNESLATAMNLDFSQMTSQDQGALFAGNQLPEGADPLAQAYAGHQFGHFTMLGDGRAILLGEHMTSQGNRLDIQLKGSGRTPYSRRGDGRAALGPMLREYILSEAMHALGIPTTRGLAVVTTGESVHRDRVLPGAILTRVAASHIRVGTFECAATAQDPVVLEALMDYTIDRHYPEVREADNAGIGLLKAMMNRQVDLIVHWMRVGFIHGVMNTDNMALSGETIDYGPCAFMDAYHPNTVFSSIDVMGRYAYANQPVMAQWNIARLAQSLLPLIDPDVNKAIDSVQQIVDSFSSLYHNKWLAMMCAKLGFLDDNVEDEMLIADLLDWMCQQHADFTHTFRALSDKDRPVGGVYDSDAFQAWYHRWQSRLVHAGKPFEACVELMQQTIPIVIPRNHAVEQALADAVAGDLRTLYRLLDALQSPYQDSESSRMYQVIPEPSEHIYQTFCGT